MTNKDLDRLLELYYNVNIDSSFAKPNNKEEYDSIKSKLEEQLEKAEKYPKHIEALMQGSNKLEQQVNQIQRDYSHLLRQKKDCEIGNNNLRGQIKELQEESRKPLELSSTTSREAVVLEIENQDLKQKLEKIDEWYNSEIECYENDLDPNWIELKSILENK